MNILWKTILSFAKGFALRCSEYTSHTLKPDKRTLKWKDLYFHKYRNKKFLSVTIRISKTNKTFKEEILTRQCLCHIKKFSKICAVCNMKAFKKLCKSKFNDDKDSYIFKREDGHLVTGSPFRKELRRALKFMGIKNVRHPYWRPHSLRYGEITDLFAANVSLAQIRKYARHVPNSETTYRYIQLETDEEAFIVSKKYIDYYLNNSL